MNLNVVSDELEIIGSFEYKNTDDTKANFSGRETTLRFLTFAGIRVTSQSL